MADATMLQAIDAALAAGVLRVRHGDRDITYPSVDDLLKARRAIEAQINSGARRQTKFSVATFNE